MRYLLNTHKNDAGTRVCIFDLYTRLRGLGVQASLNNWTGYKYHDIVVFMGYDHDIERARRENPKIKVVLADPKLSTREYISAAKAADLLLVSSVEQRDVFLQLNRNIQVYYMFPEMDEKSKVHSQSGGVVIAYHGNRVHLEAMCPILRPALEALTKTYKVTLLCIYNIANLGRAELESLEYAGVCVVHYQWSQDTLVEILFGADVGIMPNELPIRNRQNALWHTAFKIGNYAYEPFDHLVRYKASANPGRLFPFVCAGLPVIADFCPSASQFIHDAESGFIVSRPDGWYFALKKLADSAELRQSNAKKLRDVVMTVHKKQIHNFIDACSSLYKGGANDGDVRVLGVPSLEDDQQRFYNYARPQETPRQWIGRQLKKLCR